MTITKHPVSTLWFKRALLAGEWARDVRITVAAGSIVKIDVGVAQENGEAAGRVALPGIPNLHSHAFQRAMSGLTEVRGQEDDSFWSWRNLMYRFVNRMSPDDLEAVAAFAFIEMLEAGFTRVGEFHYLHHDIDGATYANSGEMAERIVAAADATGIGLTLLPVFYAHSGFGGSPPAAEQRRFIHGLGGFSRLIEACATSIGRLDDGILGLAPHSLRAVTPGELDQLVALAADGPIHVHIAEQSREVEDCTAWCGQRPVEWLMSHAAVDDAWCLVHATHVTSREVDLIARSRAVVGLCPITEANLGDGLFPGREFLDRGGAIGVGSDSNVLIDPAEELRTLEYGARLAGGGRNVHAEVGGGSTGGRLFRAAVGGGARALGVAGGLTIGAAADIFTLDRDHPTLVARHDDALLDSWIFGGARAVDGVWRRGRQVVSGGRHRHRDAIAARYRKTLTRLLA